MTTTTEEKELTKTLVTVFYLPERDRRLTKHSTATPIGATTFNYQWDELKQSYKAITLNPYLNQDIDATEWELCKRNTIVRKYLDEEVIVEIPQKDYSFDNIARTYSLPLAKQVIKLTINVSTLQKWRLNTTNAQILDAIDKQIDDVERGRGII